MGFVGVGVWVDNLDRAPKQANSQSHVPSSSTGADITCSLCLCPSLSPSCSPPPPLRLPADIGDGVNNDGGGGPRGGRGRASSAWNCGADPPVPSATTAATAAAQCCGWWWIGGLGWIGACWVHMYVYTHKVGRADLYKNDYGPRPPRASHPRSRSRDRCPPPFNRLAAACCL